MVTLVYIYFFFFGKICLCVGDMHALFRREKLSSSNAVWCLSSAARNDVRKPWQALFRLVAIKAKLRPKTTPITTAPWTLVFVDKTREKTYKDTVFDVILYLLGICICKIMPRRSKIYFHKTFLSLSKCFLYAKRLLCLLSYLP